MDLQKPSRVYFLPLPLKYVWYIKLGIPVAMWFGKKKKEFTSDLKNIYNAPTKEAAKIELDNFEQKWGTKYPYAIRSWRNNWEELTVFFDFPVEIRKIIYTTNLIENLNGKIRKYTKNKLSFPNDDALKKSVYLAINEIEKKWYQPIWNWALIFNQFITSFDTTSWSFLFTQNAGQCQIVSVKFIFYSLLTQFKLHSQYP